MGCALDTGTAHDVVLIPIAGGKSGGSLPKDLTDFQPSENQKSILEAFHEGKYVVSVSDACKAVGISRNAYYLWFQDEGFCQWWNKESDRGGLVVTDSSDDLRYLARRRGWLSDAARTPIAPPAMLGMTHEGAPCGTGFLSRQFGQRLFIGLPAGQMRLPSLLKWNSAAPKYLRALLVRRLSVLFALCSC